MVNRPAVFPGSPPPPGHTAPGLRFSFRWGGHSCLPGWEQSRPTASYLPATPPFKPKNWPPSQLTVFSTLDILTRMASAEAGRFGRRGAGVSPAPKQAGGTPAPPGTHPPAKRIPGTGVVSDYFITRYSASDRRQPALIHWAGVHIISPPETGCFSRKDFCLFML